ncbi:MAG: class I SAM-dependent methyltransferase [Lachnospiraceae bacterium]|nr:class I SAM-dependent methyltransferase [Lachnospiraceae bacterium]
MNNKKHDKELKIHTTGRDDYKADAYHHPYEPTPYIVLERLVSSGFLTKDNVVVDYGCGKGRVDFFLASKIGCKTIGIEYDRRIYESAMENKKTYSGKQKPDFLCISAEEYRIEEADCFYFFNPFSVEILCSVIGKIITSYYENPRKVRLFFYYPAKEYISYLMTKEEICFVTEIDCGDLFSENNSRERIMVFELG